MVLKRIPLIVLMLIPAFLFGASPRIVEINTRHFTIIYPSELSSSAMNITCEAEGIYTSFVNSLQYEPEARIMIRITAPRETGTCCDELFSVNSPGTIEIDAVEDPGALTRLREILFERYIESFSDKFSGLPGLSEIMISGLMDYIMYGVDDESVMMLNDYVNNLCNGEIIIGKDSRGFEGLSRLVSRFFWDYISADYGRDSLARSLKDASYSGGFFNSVAGITGKGIPVLYDGFRLYLGRFINTARREVYDPIVGIDENYNPVSHCVNAAGDSYRVLAERREGYYLLYAQGAAGSFSAVRLKPDGIKFTSIAFSGNNIVLSGYDKYGSVLICCDLNGRNILWEKKFPFIYISRICSDKTGQKILVSADVKGQSSIFLYDMKSLVLLRTEIEGRGLLHASFTHDGNILYVSSGRYRSLVLLDPLTGSDIEIYRTSNILEYPVEDPHGAVLFSETVKGITDIRSIDRATGVIENITSGMTSNIHPLVINSSLYFLSYNRGRYRTVSRNSYLK